MSATYEAERLIRQLEPELRGLDRKRKALYLGTAAAAAVVGPGGWLLMRYVLLVPEVLGVALLIALGMVALVALVAGELALRGAFQRLVIPGLAERLDPSLRFRHGAGGLPVEAYKASQLGPASVSHYFAGDRLTGDTGGAPFIACEVDAGRYAPKRNVTLFHGLFFQFTLPEPVAARVVVMPRLDGERPADGVPDLEVEPARDPEVTLDDAAFMARYRVYCADEAVARAALPAALRAGLLELGMTQWVAFSRIEQQAYVAAAHRGNLFPRDSLTSYFNPEALATYVSALQRVLRIPATLGLGRVASRR